MRQTTIKDIARAAGVSISAVSFAIEKFLLPTDLRSKRVVFDAELTVQFSSRSI